MSLSQVTLGQMVLSQVTICQQTSECKQEEEMWDNTHSSYPRRPTELSNKFSSPDDIFRLL